MAFKETADLDCSTTISLGGSDKKTGKPNPTKIEGFYVGSRQVASPKSKTGFSALHVFQTAKGNVGVWGKTNLDSKLSTVTPGQLVRATFLGMKPTKNNPMYTYKIEVDADQTIDISTAAETPQDEAEDQDTGIDGEDAGYADEEEEETLPPRAAAPARAAQAPSQSQQSRVAALLQKRR